MKEIWKPVKGYESLYQVSDSGRVRSLRTGKYISKRVGYDGYVRVSLSNNGEQKALFLHRLIGQAFVPNPNNYPEINHKDVKSAQRCYFGSINHIFCQKCDCIINISLLL